MAFTPKAAALHDQYLSMGMSNQAASDAVYAILGDSAIQGAVPIATAGLPPGIPTATTAVDTGDYTPEAAALYDQYRSMGMSHVAAKEAVIAVLGQGAVQDVSMVPVAGPLGPAASPAGVPWAPGFGPGTPGEPGIPGVMGQGEAFDTEEGLVFISFQGPGGQPVSRLAAIQAIIALITTYPALMDAVKAALGLIIRLPGRDVAGWNNLTVLCFLKNLPRYCKDALCAYEGNMDVPIGLSAEAKNVFLTMKLADYINIADDFDIEELVIEQLVG